MAVAIKVSPLSKTLSVERYTLSSQLAIGALLLPWFFTVQLRVTSCPATPAAGPSAVPTRSGAAMVVVVLVGVVVVVVVGGAVVVVVVDVVVVVVVV